MTLDEQIIACVPEHVREKCRREYYDAQGTLTVAEVREDCARKARHDYERQHHD